MLIARLIVNPLAEQKLGRRGVSVRELLQVAANQPYVTANPHPRVSGSRLIIGPTDGGRLLTVVVQPDARDKAAWHVMTAWDSTRREIGAFRAAT